MIILQSITLTLLVVVLLYLVAVRSNQKKVAEALGQAYGNVNDLHDGLVKVLGHVKADLRSDLTVVDGRIERLDERLNQVDQNLLEVVTAITTAFMQETIEIKQGIEVMVQALTEPLPATPAGAAPAAKGTPCAVKGCDKPAEVVTSWKMDILTPAEDVSVCEPHAEMMAKQAFQAPKGKAAPPPETTPKAAAPAREEFAKEHGIGEGEPDTSVLTPEPLDPITAAIEASFRAGKQA